MLTTTERSESLFGADLVAVSWARRGKVASNNRIETLPPRLLTVPAIGFLLLFLTSVPARAVEHPGVLHKVDVCSSCHADKTRGRFVHSAMALSCAVCHLVETRGDLTTVRLVMAKDQICFACHERGAETSQHREPTKGLCVDCHDSHTSDRPMLLLKGVAHAQQQNSGMPPSRDKE